MFTEEQINQVWNSARKEKNYDETRYRKDPCGAWIIRSEYGNRSSDFGWEIDHIYPESKGGEDQLVNLRPMHWANNAAKGDDYPSYYSGVTSNGSKNEEYQSRFKVNEKKQEKLRELYNIEL